MTANEKSNMIYELLNLLRTNKLNDIQKSNIYEIVRKLPNRTKLQKERFFIFYNLLKIDSINRRNRKCDIARYYNCTNSCIRVSINRVRGALIHTTDENFSIIENILKEYHNKDTQK